MGTKLTKEDIQKINEEIERRILVDRPKLIEDLKEARSHGDLSENFEYYAAKREKNINESRIRYLQNMIKYAEIIEDVSENDEVGLNKLVEIFFEDDNLSYTYKIVTPIRGDSMKGRISIESPLGKAIVGKKVGDRAKVVINGSNFYYVKILSIVYDDADDDIMEF